MGWKEEQKENEDMNLFKEKMKKYLIEKEKEGKEMNDEMDEGQTTKKLPAPPPKKKSSMLQTGRNEVSRQYLLNATQLRKLSDTHLMQRIMINVGSIASFFIQPGNKLFVHLNAAQNDTAQSWVYIEDLLLQNIGPLHLIQSKFK